MATSTAQLFIRWIAICASAIGVAHALSFVGYEETERFVSKSDARAS